MAMPQKNKKIIRHSALQEKNG